MKVIHLLITAIVLTFAGVSCSSGQAQEKIVIINLENDRAELIKAIYFLNSRLPELICLNTYLECNHDSIDQELFDELTDINSLLMPSELRPFGTGKHRDIIGCSLIHPKGAPTGFTNLIYDKDRGTIEKVQIRNSFDGRVRYHFAENIALSLNRMKTQDFIDSNPDTIAIDLTRNRKFLTYHINDFKNRKVDANILLGKIIIVSLEPLDHYPVRKGEGGDKIIEMSTAEIIANIACQIVGE